MENDYGDYGKKEEERERKKREKEKEREGIEMKKLKHGGDHDIIIDHRDRKTRRKTKFTRVTSDTDEHIGSERFDDLIRSRITSMDITELEEYKYDYEKLKYTIESERYG